MRCTLFSVTDAELQEATGELPAYADGDSRLSVTTAPVGQVLELGTTWKELHAVLGDYGVEHPLSFLVAGGTPTPGMAGTDASGRCFMAVEIVQLLAYVARVDDPRTRKLRHFLADAGLAKRGVIVHHFN